MIFKSASMICSMRRITWSKDLACPVLCLLNPWFLIQTREKICYKCRIVTRANRCLGLLTLLITQFKHQNTTTQTWHLKTKEVCKLEHQTSSTTEVPIIAITRISRNSIQKKTIVTQMQVFNTIGRKINIQSFMQVLKIKNQSLSISNQILKLTNKARDMKTQMRLFRSVKQNTWKIWEERELDQSDDASIKNIQTVLNQERVPDQSLSINKKQLGTKYTIR